MSQTVKLGLLGNNLGRSRAKNLHELLGELYDLNVTYEPMDLLDQPQPVSIAKELARCRDEGYRGVNVTHPYKIEAFSHVVTVPDFPKGLISVNTVLFTAEGMVADNTDFSGCCRAFRSRFGEAFNPGRVLMLGAGGVGVAIAYALKQLGVKALVIYDIREDVGRDLVAQLAANGLPARVADSGVPPGM